MIPLFQFGAAIDPDRLLTSTYSVLGQVGKALSIIAGVILVAVIVGAIIYFFVIRKLFYKIPVRIYEIVGGKVMYSHNERGGYIRQRGGGTIFRLMPTWKNKFRPPAVIQPDLQHFEAAIMGGRYANYIRTGKDIYMPFKMRFNLKNEAVVELAKDIDLSSIENQLTANYLKFRGEGFWTRYGNQVILITFAMILGIFLFLVAKEFTQTALILNQGQQAIAAATENLGRQIVQ